MNHRILIVLREAWAFVREVLAIACICGMASLLVVLFIALAGR